MTEVAGTERELPADLVLLAIGFGGTEPSPVFEQLGIERNPRGTITADADVADQRAGCLRGGRHAPWPVAHRVGHRGGSIGRLGRAHAYLGGDGTCPRR